MQPLPIIEHLDELEHLRPRVLTGVVVALMDELILQRAEEAFDLCVVVAVAFPTHAGDEPGLLHQSLIRLTRIQRPLIGVMNQAGRWLALPNAMRRA